MKEKSGSLLLLLAAVIWGSAFVAQSAGMEYVGPFTYSSVRNLVGAVVLLPVIRFLDHLRAKKSTAGDAAPVDMSWKNKTLWIGGLVTGVFLSVAANLQQIALQYTSVGKAGFITALYIILVPLVSVFFGKKPKPVIWLCVALACLGLYLLCMKEATALGKGDVLLLLCALFFAFQILSIDRYAHAVDPVKMSCIEFLVCSVLSGIPMLLLEKPAFGQILSAWGPILYAGVFSSGVAYTLQMVGQKRTEPAVASLMMSTESLFSALAGFLFLHQTMTGRELLGGACMLAAVIIATR